MRHLFFYTMILSTVAYAITTTDCSSVRKQSETTIADNEPRDNIDSFCIEIDGFMYTRLGAECKKGNLGKVKKLISQGADSEYAKTDEILIYDALIVAIENNHLHIVKYLVENNKADIEKPCTENLLTPLGVACRVGNEKIVDYLLIKGANPDGLYDSNTEYREIPLLIAIDNDNIKIAERLLKAGASLELTDEKGNTIRSLIAQKKGGKWDNLNDIIQ